MSRSRLSNLLVLLTVFLLPFQTRWIYRELEIGGGPWEYGRLSLYATELLVFVAVLLRGRLQLPYKLVPFQKPLALLVGVLLVSASFSQAVAVSLGFLQHLVAALAFLALLIDERTNARQTAVAFVAGLMIPSGLAWYQVVTGNSPASTWFGLSAQDAAALGASVVETGSDRILRGYGTFPHPNILGGYLAVGLMLCAWLARDARSLGSRLMAAAPVTIIASTLVITFSRSAWLSAALGFTALIAMMLLARKSLPHHAIPLAGLGLLAVIATLAVFHVPALTRFQPAARLEAKSLSERTTDYRVFDDIARLNVFTGVGPGNYTVALATIYPGRPAYSYQPIHNAILLLLAETGLIGLLAVVRIGQTVIGSARRLQSSANTLFAASILVLVAVLALFDHYLWSLWPGVILGALTLGFSLKNCS
jgi:hypothetical protein